VTAGFVQEGLDVVIFISSNMAAVVRAGRFSNPPTTPSPVRNNSEYLIQIFAENIN
jgi:hypothetical protein